MRAPRDERQKVDELAERSKMTGWIRLHNNNLSTVPIPAKLVGLFACRRYMCTKSFRAVVATVPSRTPPAWMLPLHPRMRLPLFEALSTRDPQRSRRRSSPPLLHISIRRRRLSVCPLVVWTC